MTGPYIAKHATTAKMVLQFLLATQYRESDSREARRRIKEEIKDLERGGPQLAKLGHLPPPRSREVGTRRAKLHTQGYRSRGKGRAPKCAQRNNSALSNPIINLCHPTAGARGREQVGAV